MNKMKISIQSFIQEWLLKEGCELNLRLNRIKKNITVTISQNLPQGTSENEMVRKEQHCQTINTYRNGKKTGMKIITNMEIDFEANIDSETGDPEEQPIAGHSLDIANSDDPPYGMCTNTKSNEG
ncbi:MAG: hypothetical protein IPM91_02140 [Bacteroidetes bacterium]|nr:hypothetical protein [Bacteroidota bacterium]